MSQILFYHYGALGDFITVLPLFTYLKRHNYHLTLLGKPGFGEIARANGSLDAVIDSDSSKQAFLCSHTPEPEKIRAFLAPFSKIVLFSDPSAPLAQNILTCSGGRCICCKPFTNNNQHVIDAYFTIFPETTTSLADRIPDLTNAIVYFKNVIATSLIPRIDTRTVLIHPGSGSALKNWPVERFLLLADALRKKGYAIAWIAGPAEHAFHFPSGDLQFNNRSLPECMLIMAQCTAYCGNDSGISHLATAVGCRAVVIFGPSNPHVWAPRGISNTLIVTQPASCTPCHLIDKKICNRQCLTDITVDNVLAALTTTIETA